MEFPEVSFPQGMKSFVSHRDVLEYLRNYAVQSDVTQNIRLNNRVDSVQAVQPKKHGSDVRWKILSTPQNSDTPTEEVFDSVIVCNGYLFVFITMISKNLPDFPLLLFRMGHAKSGAIVTLP